MPTASSVDRLVHEFRATRVSFTMWGVKRAFDKDQKARAASAFDADVKYVAGSKKIIDTSHPRYRAVTALKSQIGSYWKGLTVPYPEPGYRLIREETIADFDASMTGYRSEFLQSVRALDQVYAEIRQQAQIQLGSLFRDSDYPVMLDGLFDVTWDFPSVEPPSYLAQLKPELYELERQRMVARFQEAAQQTEAMFVEQFAELVEHLAERLTGTDDNGRPKRFGDSSIENVVEFINRFRTLSVGGNDRLDDLVTRAERMVRGVNPDVLRPREDGTLPAGTDALRRHFRDTMDSIANSLGGMMENKPRRRIDRSRKPEPVGAV